MDVEIHLNQEETEKAKGKLVVFCDVEYRIYPSLFARLRSRWHHGRLRSGDILGENYTGKLILQGLCGALRPARLTFILGPSGAGKSTLLQILAGRRREGVSGNVYGGQSAVLVGQQATLLPAFTAREVLFFAASLKLPLMETREKLAVVERVARQLGIESTLDTRTPQLSGGERKRLSVACELLTDPPVLLLDEPTSGLDSVSSLSVVRALATVAASGRTVACVLHQPASRLYSAADDLILLAGGRTLYAGPRSEVPTVLLRAGFECPNFYNPADYLLEVATKEHAGDYNLLEKEARAYSYPFQNAIVYTTVNGNGKGQEITVENFRDGFQRKREKRESGDDKIYPLIVPHDKGQPRTYAASGWTQVRGLLWRCGISGLRDVHLTQLRLGAHVLVALLLGALYAGAGGDAARVHTNASCLFFFLLFLFFSNAMPTIQTFPAEADVVIQEHLNYWYSVPAYWLSKILADIPLQLLCATVFTIPAWLLTGQPTAECWRLVFMWLVCVLLTVLAQTSGLAIGAACDVKAGLFIVPASNIPMLMFSGYFIPYNEMPAYLQPLASISYFRYAFDAALQCVYGFGRETLECTTDFCLFRKPEKFLSTLALPNDYWGSVSALVVWILILQAMLMLVLVLRVRLACK